jgi:hypothetical protein
MKFRKDIVMIYRVIYAGFCTSTNPSRAKKKPFEFPQKQNSKG